ncbi:hypothetical protein GTY23_45105 [Streptomyces sp. SID5998]|nr:hypothetical protein [Streptomyces sp. SID5998]
MAQESWPNAGHNTRAVTDTEYETLASRFSDDGVYGSPADTAVVSAGPGLAVTIRPNVAASVRGHGWTSGSTAVSIPIDANASGSPRTDRIVLRLDRSDWTVTAAKRTGTPGGGTPALVQNSGDTGLWEIPLALATVASGSGTVTVTRSELYVGTRCRPCTSTTRNPTPRIGELGFETDTGRTIQWDGSAWQVVYEDSGETVLSPSAVSGWAVEGQTIIQVRSGIAYVRFGDFRRTSALQEGVVSRLPIILPPAYQPRGYWQYPLVYLTSARLGRLTVYSRGSDRAGQVWLNEHPALSAGQYVLSTSASWAV